MKVEFSAETNSAPMHLLRRRKLLQTGFIALIDVSLGNRANAIIPSPESSPRSPVEPPLTLMYHDINFPRPGNIDEEGNWIPPKRFMAQIEILQAAGYDIGTASEALSSPEKTVALTFDDGLHTAYDLVYPFLRKRNIKATFFVPVDALFKGDRGNRYFMTEKQVKEMSEDGQEIASHSYDHVSLTSWSSQMVKLELRRSKEFLEDLIGKEVPLFAYPNGKHTRSIAEDVLKAGYRAAFVSRTNTRLGLEPPLDRFELPRFWIVQKMDPTRLFPTRQDNNSLRMVK